MGVCVSLLQSQNEGEKGRKFSRERDFADKTPKRGGGPGTPHPRGTRPAKHPQTSPQPGGVGGSNLHPPGQAPAGRRHLWIRAAPGRINQSSQMNYVPNSLDQSELYSPFPTASPVTPCAAALPALFKDAIPLPKQGPQRQIQSNY